MGSKRGPGVIVDGNATFGLDVDTEKNPKHPNKKKKKTNTTPPTTLSLSLQTPTGGGRDASSDPPFPKRGNEAVKSSVILTPVGTSDSARRLLKRVRHSY